MVGAVRPDEIIHLQRKNRIGSSVFLSLYYHNQGLREMILVQIKFKVVLSL